MGEQQLLLSVDFEDWHQLVRRRVGVDGWEQAGPALGRQTRALLELFDELGVRATFFILGMAARAHPELVEQVVAHGHEIGCHGDAHRPVHSQSPEQFAADLRSARETIERLTGQRPLGYRAPAFSITRETDWAYRVLAELGFQYDASHHDSVRIRGRVSTADREPYQLASAPLWEFPVAVWHSPALPVPVGGASYWCVMPTSLVLHGLGRAGPLPWLYLHPHELDPEPLDAQLPAGSSATQRAHALVKSAQRNLARRRATEVLRAIARSYRLITYGEAHAKLSDGVTAGP
jgi:polysaccharide deacetylase family protein (PEP-CTERM system associated)